MMVENRGRLTFARGAAALFAMALVIAAAGSTAACTRSEETNRALDPSNQIPFGNVDTPITGTTVPATIPIGGWAMDDKGVKEVRFYIDGRFVTMVALTTPRPDVTKAFPQFARGTDNHGWASYVTFETPGIHTVVVQAADSDGATRDIGSLTLTAQPK